MNKGNKRYFYTAAAFLAAFVVWTVLVITVDVRPVGADATSIGLASVNKAFHNLTGVHMWMYDLTDLLSIIPLGLIGVSGMMGLVQLIRRKSIFKVDRDILALGVFYAVVMAAFLLFEAIPVNFRPILIEGQLEASYPSSTTMLVMCVMPVSAMMLGARIRRIGVRRFVTVAFTLFTIFMVTARMLSGVHWISDIIGGALLSTDLVIGYKWAAGISLNE